jgi:hypothetical protein
VAIAASIFQLFHQDKCDTLVLMTGDTDLRPAVLTAKQIYNHKTILFAFPYRRKNNELSAIAPGSFRLSKNSYQNSILPDPFILKNGTVINKPADW